MRMTPACGRMLVAGAVLALACSPALAAPAAPAAADKDTVVNPVEKLRKDLDKTITLKIDKQSLTAAIEALRTKANINVVLDGVTIQQQLGFLPDQPPAPVEVDFKDARVRTVLRTIISPYGLSYAPIGDTVIVTTDDMAMMRQMRQRINVDMDKVEFATALRQIGHETAVNLILDSRVEKLAGTKVTLQLEDVPLETAVRLLAEMAGLKPVRVGNVLFVTSKENAAEMRADPDVAQPNPNVRAQELQLQQLQQAQLQLNINGAFQPGIQPGVPPNGIAAPPGIAPILPPSVPPIDAPKEDKTADPKAETPVDVKTIAR